MIKLLCHECGSKMVKKYDNVILTTYPAQRTFTWWCSCGASASGGTEPFPSQNEEELLLDEWEEENNKKLSEVERQELLEKFVPKPTYTYHYYPPYPIYYNPMPYYQDPCTYPENPYFINYVFYSDTCIN